MVLTQHSVNSDWLINIQSKVLQAAWITLETNEKATFNINMPYLYFILCSINYAFTNLSEG